MGKGRWLCEHLLCIGVSGRDSLRAVLVYRPRFAAYSPVKMSRRRKFCARFTKRLHSPVGCGKLSMVSGMRRKGELPGAALNKTVMTKPDREGARVPG